MRLSRAARIVALVIGALVIAAALWGTYYVLLEEDIGRRPGQWRR